jgi:hypothetical protein
MHRSAWQLENRPWVEPWKKLMKLQFRRRKNGRYTCEGQNLVYGFVKGKNHWMIRIYDPADARNEPIQAGTCASYTDCVDFCQRFENRATRAEQKSEAIDSEPTKKNYIGNRIEPGSFAVVIARLDKIAEMFSCSD